MLKGLLSVPSSVVILLFRRVWGIEVALFVAALCSVVTHCSAHFLGRPLTRKGVSWFVISVPVFYAASVLFGGPLLSVSSLAWACFLGATFVLPEREEEQRTLSCLGRDCSWFLVSGVVASWIGCFAIPLDWDVEWQVFPVASALLASAASVVFGCII